MTLELIDDKVHIWMNGCSPEPFVEPVTRTAILAADLLYERITELLDNAILRPFTSKLAAEVRAVRKERQKRTIT